MQEDMHYYGTYALARCAGLPIEICQPLAYSAQFVDDSEQSDSQTHEDGGMLYGIATAHDNVAVVKNQLIDHIAQRRVWVPFHFFPGNIGDTLEEKMVCRKDSDLAREMIANNVAKAVSAKDYGPYLMGITAHVYADTFAHYGFSGVSCNYNKVENNSIRFLNIEESDDIRSYILKKESAFKKLYKRLVSSVGEAASDGLGHGGVATYPDRPYLCWQFDYQSHSTLEEEKIRDNQKTYLEAAEKLHAVFLSYAQQLGLTTGAVEFDVIADKIEEILRVKGSKEERSEAWIEAINRGELFKAGDERLDYDPEQWSQQKADFATAPSSAIAAQSDVYRFHQAAVYHRYYTLKDLLPRHGITVI